MNLENLKRAKVLLETSHKLKNLIPNHFERIESPSCDKYDLKFGGDDRFAVFKCTVFLDCHHGYYGNSSCSCPVSIDNTDAQNLLNRALNKHMQPILDTMAAFAREDAVKMKGEIQKELDAAAELMDSICTEEESQQN